MSDALKGILLAAAPMVIFAGTMFAIHTLPQAINNIKERMSVSRSSIKEKNVIEKMKEGFKGIEGQDAQLQEIIDIVSGWVEAKNNPSGKRGGLVIHLAGISGTGKSTAAKAVARAFLGEKAKPFCVSYSSINPNSPKTVKEQLLGQSEEALGQVRVTKHTALASQLKYYPKTVIMIDELDKFMLKDDSMESLLWDFTDDGIIEVNGERVDCRDAIIIITSNSSAESVGKGKDTGYDASKSLTKVKYKQAFLNRINTIYFNDFSKEIYAKILKNNFKVVQKYYNKKFKMNIKISDEDISKMAEKLKTMETGGARNIRPFVNKLYVALSDYRKKHRITESSELKSRDVSLVYDVDSTTFSAE